VPKKAEHAELLAELDAERRASGAPAGRGGVVRELAGSECRIVYSRLAAGDADEVIAEEAALARERGLPLEWKLYGHDTPADLAGRLLAAGFVAQDPEQVLVLPVSERPPAEFGGADCTVRRVHDEEGLADYAEIAREIGRTDAEQERRRLSAVLREAPDTMTVHIAYLRGEPVACGRAHFRPGGPHAELAGGRTKPAHRDRGYFTAVVASRLQEAWERDRRLAFTDALPTSERILRNRGFRPLTSTRPFLYDPTRC